MTIPGRPGRARNAPVPHLLETTPRPLDRTLGVLVEGAVYAFFLVLGFATVGLVLALRRPQNPIGWLYGAAGLAWAYTVPLGPRVDQLIREHRSLPALLLPNGHLRSTVLLGLGYAGVVLGLGRLLPDRSSLVVAAATLAVVAAFAPLRRRVQELVDRRFNRRRHDAASTVEGFAARLRDQLDLDALHGEPPGVVERTMQPTRASLRLRHAP